MPVAIIVLLALGMLTRVRENVRAVLWSLVLIAVDLTMMGIATAAFQFGWLGPLWWMVAVGAGLYLAYTPSNALLFDRLMAATSFAGNAGFLPYVADASGYCGSVALLLLRSVGHVSLRWSSFLCGVCYATCAIGSIATTWAMQRFRSVLGDGRAG